ncbi:MAG: Uncharacterized protein FD133_841 [Erysipelotrichaceae bacterium]|nr:MAG: Uncharacterized protein FD133_841 [Erysipelotrichaceae bacterium]
MKIAKFSLKTKNSKTTAIFFVMIFGIFLFRSYNLDADLPSWGMTTYQPIDEGQYVMMAINEIEYGTWRPDTVDLDVNYYTPEHMRNNVIGNVIAYVGLKVFGDNYYGIRMGSVLLGFINFGLFIMILFELKKKYGSGNRRELLFIMGISLYTVTEFTFLIASRVVEPSILRMLFINLTIYLFLKLKEGSYSKYFLLGFLSVLSVFAVYITNIFLVLAIGLFVLLKLIKNDKSNFFMSFFGFCSGSAFAYILCELYYYFGWGSSSIINTFNIFKSFSGVSKYVANPSLINSFRYFLTNFNLYNAIIFVIFIICLPIFVAKAVQTKDEFMSLLIVLYVVFFLQTMVVDDYIQRKFIIMLPLVFFVIFITLLTTDKGKFTVLLEKPLFKLVFGSYVLAVVVFASLIIYFRLYLINDLTHNDFSSLNKILLLTQIPVLFLMFINIVLNFHKHKQINKTIFRTILIGVGFNMALNFYFDSAYVWFNRSYSEKNAMIEIGKIANDQHVYGIFSTGYTLYNTIKPVNNSAEELDLMLIDRIPAYYLDYQPEKLIFTKYQFIELCEYERVYTTFGLHKNIFLYKTENVR